LATGFPGRGGDVPNDSRGASSRTSRRHPGRIGGFDRPVRVTSAPHCAEAARPFIQRRRVTSLVRIQCRQARPCASSTRFQINLQHRPRIAAVTSSVPNPVALHEITLRCRRKWRARSPRNSKTRCGRRAMRSPIQISESVWDRQTRLNSTKNQDGCAI
jgi:hypothetical protein